MSKDDKDVNPPVGGLERGNLNILVGSATPNVRACFCVGKVAGCTCGGRCRCDCSCTEAKIKDDHSVKSWSQAVKDYHGKGY